MGAAARTAPVPGPDAETAPAGVHACPHCAERHARDAYLALHVGRDHADAMTPRERERYARALATEEAWLADFRKHVRGGMNALPVVAVYLLIALMVFVSGIPPFFAFVLLPGAVGFGALLYFLGYGKTTPPAR